MGHVLMIGFPGEGHINPSLGLIKELQYRGERIVYYAIEEYAENIKITGSEVRFYPDFRNDLGLAKNLTGDEKRDFSELIYKMTKYVKKVVELVYQEVRDETYDYVLFDHHFLPGKMIANMLGLPGISLCTTFAMNEEVVKSFHQQHQANLENSPYFEKCMQALEELSAQYPINLQHPSDVFSCSGDLTIVFTSKDFQPHPETFPNDYLFVGPSITNRTVTDDFPFAELEHQKLIVISMGTIFNQQEDIYNMCLEALKDFDGKVVMSIGKYMNPANLNEIPKHFIVRPYIPQLELLEKADLFVTHGGMNSTNEGLYFDTPLLVIPMGADQFMVAEQVGRRGAGIKLDKRKLSSVVLKEKIDKVLGNNQYADAAAKIGESLRNSGGYYRAANAILDIRK
ncbi:glycosyltransferase [Bacillus sp. CLL-7-23]|uniref:Glycosyltransferase n=1 Tax=Bacillus changyiensis TaxID=3004103 RepID=A0ABT4X464_9BACI|nr:macrolide family glycosyltransferase [Bacillus changyiensis]MDA7026534.1 glycosyltransferase [Bacillus changyiensis]